MNNTARKGNQENASFDTAQAGSKLQEGKTGVAQTSLAEMMHSLRLLAEKDKIQRQAARQKKDGPQAPGQTAGQTEEA